MINEIILQILQSYVANYPILKAWHLVTNRPIGLVFNDESRMASYLKSLSPQVYFIDKSTKLKQAEQMLYDANSLAVCIKMLSNYDGKSTKLNDLIAAMDSAATLGEVNGKSVCAAIFFAFEKLVPTAYKHKVLEIHVKEPVASDSHNYLQVVPNANQLELVKDKIRESGAMNLSAAAIFLYPKIQDRNKFAEIKILAQDLEEQSENYKNSDSVADLVIEQIFSYADTVGNVFDVYTLPSIGKVKWQDSFFISADGRFMYCTEAFFKQIVDPMREVAGLNIIKTALLECGILRCESRTYTTQMDYLNDEHVFERKRMMKFDLVKIPERDGVSLHDILTMNE